MQTDILFYDLIGELPQVFFKLIGKPDINASAYTFSASPVCARTWFGCHLVNLIGRENLSNSGANLSGGNFSQAAESRCKT